jgi:hypothetical protein
MESSRRCTRPTRSYLPDQPEEKTRRRWRAYSDGVGELIVFCPECAEREFVDGFGG